MSFRTLSYVCIYELQQTANLNSSLCNEPVSILPVSLDVWIFHSRHSNNKIKKIFERAFKIAYKDCVSSFDILLERDKSVTIHTKNL